MAARTRVAVPPEHRGSAGQNRAALVSQSAAGAPSRTVEPGHLELGSHGIRAVAIAPTRTETPGVAKAAERAAGFADALQADATGLPLRRLGHPDDVARVVLFAASDLGAFVSGSVIAADGGDLAR